MSDIVVLKDATMFCHSLYVDCLECVSIACTKVIDYWFTITQEQKIKEGLYMMGLKDGIFYLSWFITYALQVDLSSLPPLCV